MTRVEELKQYATEDLITEAEFFEIYKHIKGEDNLQLRSLRTRHARGNDMPERVTMFGKHYYKDESVKKYIDRIKKGQKQKVEKPKAVKGRIRVQPLK